MILPGHIQINVWSRMKPEMNRKIFLGFTAFSVIVVIGYNLLSLDRDEAIMKLISSIDLKEFNQSKENIHAFAKDIVTLAHQIAKAKQHVRGTKSADSLTTARNIMTKILRSFRVNYARLVHRQALQPVSVCPEIYKGRFGYPYYDTGFVSENCSYAKRLEDLITIVFVYEDSQTYDVDKLLNSVREYNPKLPIIIGAKSAKLLEKISSSFTNINTFSAFDSQSNIGGIWNQLINKIKTKYTLVAHDVIWFNHDARLDRLIRMIERLDLSAAGGAFRDVKGNWFKGCQQRVLRNFTLVYEAGYDESFDECLFCDHIDGPFVIKTSKIQKVKFNEKILSQGLYEDLFLRLSTNESVVCPDAMFYTNRTERSYHPQDWNSFVKSWPMYKIKFSGRDIMMPTQSSYPCRNARDTTLTPWCQKEIVDVIHDVMNVCLNLKLHCEIDSETIMGAVKFHGVLPWERKSEMVFLSTNYSQIAQVKATLEKMGYSVSLQDTVKNGRPNDAFITLNSKHWRLEMRGTAVTSSEASLKDNQPPTMVLIDDKRFKSPRNPGLWARNRYGPDIYEHIQHLADPGDQLYKANKFLQCIKPGYRGCLDIYNADGNLHFRDPIP